MNSNLQPIVVFCQQLIVVLKGHIMQVMEIPTKEEILRGFSFRMNELCDEKAIPPKGKNRQTVLGKIFEVSQEAARKWLEAGGMPNRTSLVRIAAWGNVNIEWLETGRGIKRGESATHVMTKPQELVLRAMQDMDIQEQYLAARLVDQVVKHEKEQDNSGTQ